MLRTVLLSLLGFIFGTYQRYLCLPRVNGRVLSPTYANADFTVTFPDYTFYATPYYVKPTYLNSGGVMAFLNKYYGLPIAGAKWGGNGVRWESMGAKFKDETIQAKTEQKVREQAEHLAKQPFGYRAKVGFEKKSIVVDEHTSAGYGAGENAYTVEEMLKQGPTVLPAED